MADLLKNKISITQVIPLVLFVIGTTASILAVYYGNERAQINLEFHLLIQDKEVQAANEKQDMHIELHEKRITKIEEK